MDDRKAPASPWDGVKYNPRQVYTRSLWYLLAAVLLGIQAFRIFEPFTAGALAAVFLALAVWNIFFRRKRLKVYEAVLKAEEEARQRELDERNAG